MGRAQCAPVDRIVIVRLEEHGARVAHDAVHPAFVADDLQPVVPVTPGDADRGDVAPLEDIRPGHDSRRQFAVLLERLIGAHLLGIGKILDGGDAPLTGFFQHRSNADQTLLEWHGRDDVLDQVNRGAAQDAGDPTVFVPGYLATDRIGSVFVNTGQVECQGIGQIHAAIEAADQHRVLVGERIDELPVGCKRSACHVGERVVLSGRALAPLFVRAPGATDDPAAFRQSLGGTFYTLGECDGLMDVKQVYTGVEHAGRVHVHMAVVEPWAREGAFEINNLSVFTGGPGDFVRAADRKDPVPADGNGFRPGVLCIHRVDPAVGEDEIGLDVRYCQVARQQAGEHERSN